MKWHVLTLRRRAANEVAGADQWCIPKALIETADPKGIRLLPRLGVLGVLAEDNAGPSLSRQPGVLHAITPAAIAEISGSFYLNLLLAWEDLLDYSEKFDGVVVNMSLGPPDREEKRFCLYEPINRALRLAYQQGVVTVLAAGNDGETGDDSMTRWAKTPWVISAGAANRKGDRVEPYSSRGVPGHPRRHPTVVANGLQGLGSDSEGTSYSTPKVTDIALLIVAFLFRVLDLGNESPGRIRKRLPRIVRHCLTQSARPMKCAMHECGAGFVDWHLTVNFLRDLTAEQLSALLHPAVDLTPQIVSQAQSELEDPHCLIGHQTLARVGLDTTYEWTRPTFVDGLLHLENSLLLRKVDEFKLGRHFDVARTQLDKTSFIETSLLPHQQRARQFIVSQAGEPGAYSTITAALAEAQEFDVLRIRPGNYVEELELRSGVTMIGETGVIIQHPSKPPVSIIDCTDVALIDVEILAAGPRREAVSIALSKNVVFRNCRIESAHGNGLTVFRSKRLVIQGGSVHGAINAAYCAFNEQCNFQRAEITGVGMGILFYACSGLVKECVVNAETGTAILAIPPRASWKTETITVNTHPMGEAIINTRDITPETVGEGSIAEFVAKALFGLELDGSTLTGPYAAVVATNFKFIVLKNCLMRGGKTNRAVIHSSEPLPIFPPSPVSIFELHLGVQKSLDSAQLAPLSDV